MEMKRLCVLSCQYDSHNNANHTVSHNDPDEKETKSSKIPEADETNWSS